MTDRDSLEPDDPREPDAAETGVDVPAVASTIDEAGEPSVSAVADAEPAGAPPRARWSDRRWRVVVASLVPVVLLAALLGFGLGRDPRATQQGQLIGKPAPDFALQDLHTGKTVRLSDFRGHPVVLNFWASDCVECIVEHPTLVSAWQRFGNEGTVFLSVLYQDTPGKAAEFCQNLPCDWPDLWDPGGRTALNYGVTGVPETVFITPDGHIAAKQISVVSFPLIEQQIHAMTARRA